MLVFLPLYVLRCLFYSPQLSLLFNSQFDFGYLVSCAHLRPCCPLATVQSQKEQVSALQLFQHAMASGNCSELNVS
jgi:hypothetical protein